MPHTSDIRVKRASLHNRRKVPHRDPPSPLTLICSACRAGPFSDAGLRQAVAKGPSDKIGYRYVTTWNAISQSIDNDACGWCCIIRRARDATATTKSSPSGEESVEVRVQVFLRKHWKSVLRLYLNGNLAARYSVHVHLGDIAAQEIQKHLRKKHIDYPRALEFIKECSAHDHCPTVERTYLPTRVIDCSDSSKPRLVDTQRKIRGHYCALSYVWGGEQHQKTTTSNIDTYIHEGINIPLPQTIIDAISVTNKLGIQYLWVDALCIIQDSSEDKVKELGIMALIYRNAFLTISAQSAFHADQGFLPDEREPHIFPFHLADRSMPPGQIILRSMRMEQYSIPPLDQRGWCFQESLLSPRKLVFQPDRRITYKCHSFSERDLSKHPLYPEADGLPLPDHVLLAVNKNRDTARAAGDIYLQYGAQILRQRWQGVLTDYSQRGITVPSDKFVALASVVEAFQPLLQDRYIAGLWRATLLHDLLWDIAPDKSRLPRPAGYRAPSWSWASVDGDVFNYSPDSDYVSHYEAEILACEATPKISALPFGEITDARLVLKAKVHPLSRGGREVGKIRFDCLEGREEHPRMDLHLIMLIAQKKEEKHIWMEGLVVLPVDGKPEQYRRVAKWAVQEYGENGIDFPGWFDVMPLETVTLI